MNRIEFMTELAALLQDVPEEERRDAMQYYNDYFDDAGEEQEQQVITELESPAKVAEKIKADLTEQRNGESPDEAAHQQTAQGGYEYQKEPEENKPWSSNILKVILIIAILLVGAPVIIPLALAVVLTALACVAALFAFFIAIVVGFAAIAIVGVSLVIAGLAAMVPEIAVGLALFGTGLILGVIGTVGTIAGIKLCIVVLPGIFRGIVWVCRKPFHRKAVA